MMSKRELDDFIAHLENIHRNVDKQIEVNFRQYDDDMHLKMLKKKKLELKDQIEHYKMKRKELE
jgi:hypothetical protein